MQIKLVVVIAVVVVVVVVIVVVSFEEGGHKGSSLCLLRYPRNTYGA